jgi:multicomponent Na+:H+ antiporter subunit C
MYLMYSIVVGVLFGSGCFLILRRSFLKTLLGLMLISYGANLLIFVGAGLTRGSTPLIADSDVQLPASAPDSLSQALLLTAIVIGFAMTAYLLVLSYRTYQVDDVDDTDQLSKEPQ